MSNILLISYYFPPFNSAGSNRAAELYQNIIKDNYNINVLTTDKYINKKYNDDVLIIKEPINFKKKLNKTVNKKINNRSKLIKILEKIIIPDFAIFWSIKVIALLALKKINANYDLVITTSPPESVHLIGLYFKVIKKVKWISDFRDGWMFESSRNVGNMGCFNTKINSILEKYVCDKSDAVVSCTEPITKNFKIRYGNLEKFKTITNSFNKNEFNKSVNTVNHKIILVHAGNLNTSRPGRTLISLIESLQSLKLNNTVLYNKILIKFFGNYTPDEIELLKKTSISNSIEINGLVERDKIIDIMCNADGLILITEENKKSIATAKLFDYLGAQKPIISFSENDAASEILRNLDCGFIVGHNNALAFQKSLEYIYGISGENFRSLSYEKNFKYESEIVNRNYINLVRRIL